MTSKPFLIACAENIVEHNLESPKTNIYRKLYVPLPYFIT